MLPSLKQLRVLELWQVSGLSDLAPVGELPALQSLFLQSLRRDERLPSFERCESLRRVHLETMKGLHDLSPLRTAPALEELLIYDMRHLSVDDLSCLTLIPTLRKVDFRLGSARKNTAARELLRLPRADRYNFVFR
jgi:hypothetical protein